MSTLDIAPRDAETVRQFGPCAQCGSMSVGVRFHDGQPHCANCRRDTIDAPSCRYSDCGRERTYQPHLLVRCERCRAFWIEEPGLTEGSDRT